MYRPLYLTPRREVHLVREIGLRTSMGLSGFTHVSGLAGSGKTMLAIAIAADASRMSQVEWVNTDSKTRFIPHLKATVTHFGGVDTRVIDMARTDPVLWGQELLEEALPTLAALTENREIDVIVMSEIRTIPEVGDLPVHSKAISKWADKTVKVCLDSSGKSSSVFIEEDGNYREIAHLEVLEDGACHLSLSHHKGVTQNCLEKEF
ncbi:MAG: hypothetical protein ACW96N_07520 [Candidatus Thorarchaeota archaeon]